MHSSSFFTNEYWSWVEHSIIFSSGMISFADLDDGDLDDSVADHIKACRFQVKKAKISG
jgi:hypothetical protein